MTRQLVLFCRRCGSVLTHEDGESFCAICPGRGMARQLEIFCECGHVLTHKRGESFCNSCREGDEDIGCIRPEGIVAKTGRDRRS